MLSSLARHSQEPKLKRILEIMNFSFFTLIDLNHGYSRPWDIFLNVVIIMLPKKSFSQKNIWILMHGFKSTILAILKILFNLGSCEYLARLKNRIRKCLFFDGSLLWKYSVTPQGCILKRSSLVTIQTSILKFEG